MSKDYQSPTSAPLSTRGRSSSGRVDGLAEQQDYGNAWLAQQLSEGACEDLDGGAPPAELGAARAGAPTSKAEALARHDANQDRVVRFIDSALSVKPDPTQGFDSRANLLHNSAEWVEEGEATLFVLTPTHDAHLRPSVAADQQSYFDTRVDFRAGGATYNDTLDSAGAATDDTGLAIKFSGVRGTMSGDGQTLTLVDPVSTSESKLSDIFIHEVQHDADQHRTGEAWEVDRPAADPAALSRAPQWAYNSYQTEFRAYWMMAPEGSSADWFGSSGDTAVSNLSFDVVQPGKDGKHGTSDDVKTSVTTAFANRRQQDIFKHMFQGGKADGVYLRDGDWTQSYGYLPHYYALDPAFRAMVDAYATPVSGNLINSVRVQALSEALAAGDQAAILDAADELDALDRAYLADRTQSQPLWDQAASSLTASQLAVFESAVAPAPVCLVPSGESVAVVAGDTLSALADRYLGDMARWPEIYRLNRAVVGDDPNRLSVGLTLELPAM